MWTKTFTLRDIKTNVSANSLFHCCNAPLPQSFVCIPSASLPVVPATHELLLSSLLHETSKYRQNITYTINHLTTQNLNYSGHKAINKHCPIHRKDMLDICVKAMYTRLLQNRPRKRTGA